MTSDVTQVGAPDPEQRTAPILGEGEQFSSELDLQTGVCGFNGAAFPHGTCVQSGAGRLHCVERGLWVRTGP